MDYFNELQSRFAQPCSPAGKLECLNYQSRAYALEALFGESPIPTEKKMWVYTPPGYDPGNRYDVLFLMHGGTDNEGYWFGKGRYHSADTERYAPCGNITASMMDHLINDGAIQPLIAVAPSFEEEVEPYASRGNRAANYFASSYFFWQELRNDIMPLVQRNYSTYAENATDAGFAAAREHFAYVGASQGSITGLVSVASHCLDRVAWIGSFSAGVCQFALEGQQLSVFVDEPHLVEVSEAMKQAAPLFWYNGCGDNDMMLSSHKESYDRLLAALPDQLQEGRNCCFTVHPGGKHDYQCWSEDLYNVLQIFFH